MLGVVEEEVAKNQQIEASLRTWCGRREIIKQIPRLCTPQVPLGMNYSIPFGVRKQVRMRRDVEAQVLDQLCFWVVCHEHFLGAVQGADEAWEAGAGAELEDCLVGYEGLGVLFEVCGESAAGVPEEVALCWVSLLLSVTSS